MKRAFPFSGSAPSPKKTAYAAARLAIDNAKNDEIKTTIRRINAAIRELYELNVFDPGAFVALFRSIAEVYFEMGKDGNCSDSSGDSSNSSNSSTDSSNSSNIRLMRNGIETISKALEDVQEIRELFEGESIEKLWKDLCDLFASAKEELADLERMRSQWLLETSDKFFAAGLELLGIHRHFGGTFEGDELESLIVLARAVATPLPPPPRNRKSPEIIRIT